MSSALLPWEWGADFVESIFRFRPSIEADLLNVGKKEIDRLAIL
ncbi:MAG: hypothetical protein QN720_05965 [Nitrososphaeraceae archaeon]|nr:hypothetical protein [Nitrososphaeraceae archaeon]MDW0332492.1 hypothetical protein [Nitrososphaeraceae archaeon]